MWIWQMAQKVNRWWRGAEGSGLAEQRGGPSDRPGPAASDEVRVDLPSCPKGPYCMGMPGCPDTHCPGHPCNRIGP